MGSVHWYWVWLGGWQNPLSAVGSLVLCRGRGAGAGAHRYGGCIKGEEGLSVCTPRVGGSRPHFTREGRLQGRARKRVSQCAAASDGAGARKRGGVTGEAGLTALRRF